MIEVINYLTLCWKLFVEIYPDIFVINVILFSFLFWQTMVILFQLKLDLVQQHTAVFDNRQALWEKQGDIFGLGSLMAVECETASRVAIVTVLQLKTNLIMLHS